MLATLRRLFSSKSPAARKRLKARRAQFRQPLALRFESLEERRVLACVGEFTTFTQGGWGAEPSGNNPGVYLHANFDDAFPGGLQIGSQTPGEASSNDTAGNWAALFTSAQAITDWLPHGGPSGALGGDTIDPFEGSDPDDGTLAGQTLALSLSVGFDLYDPDFSENTVNLKDLTIVSGPFAGKTVQFVLDTSNAILSGITTTGYTAAQANTAATAINENFDNGTVDTGFLSGYDCSECDDAVQSSDDEFIGGVISGHKFEDMDGDGDLTDGDTSNPIEGWTITLYQDTDANGSYETQIGSAQLTGADGSYSFVDLQAGDYRVIEADAEGWTHTTVTYYDITLTESVEVTVEEINGLDDDECIDEVLTSTITTVSSAAGNDFGNFKNIDICGAKYEDHNGNGIKDNSDAGKGGFTFILNDDGDGIAEDGEVTTVSAADGTWCFTNVGPGAWKVTEAFAGLNWVPTQGEDGYSGEAVSGANVTDLIFGNTNVGVENGKTIGFWSNKNGQALINAADIAALNTANLKTATGADAVFTNAASVKNFLLSANATNMANMLSAQLAGTILNFRHGNFGSSTAIYVEGIIVGWSGNSQGANLTNNLDNDFDLLSDSDGLVNEYGFASIQGLINAANDELAAHSNTTSGTADAGFRTYQEALKIAFDAMNNNLAIFAL